MDDKNMFQWMKCSDIHREYCTFELRNGDEIVMDIGFSDSGVLEVGIGSSNKCYIIEFDQFIELLNEGRKYAEEDK